MSSNKHDTENVFVQLNKEKKEKKGGYRYNLNLNKDLKTYLKNKAWQDRISATDYINNLIKADMEKYFADGGTTEGWIDIDE